MNLRWSWHPPLRDLFESIDPARWAAVGQRPGRDALGASSPTSSSASPPTRPSSSGSTPPRRPSTATSARTAGTSSGAASRPRACPSAIAYFSAEFGITAALPQYSGGLGILAGDHLKAASDIGVPIVGVGLFYKTGYFRQSLNRDGWQQEDYPVLDPDGLPLSLLREEDGTPRPSSPSTCPAAASCTPTSGAPRSAGCRCCCSTPTCTATTRPAAASPSASTAAAASCACSRRCCSAWAACARCGSGRASPAPRPRRLPRQRGPRRLPRRRADQRARARREA